MLSGEDSTGRDFSVDIASTEAFAPASSAASDSPFLQIAGYRIDGPLGQGRMGVVYKATQLALNPTVALKMILHRDTVSEDQLRRFEREAKAVAEFCANP